MSKLPEHSSRWREESLKLVEAISDNASDIRGDWSDPRTELRAIQNCCDNLRTLLASSETANKISAEISAASAVAWAVVAEDTGEIVSLEIGEIEPGEGVRLEPLLFAETAIRYFKDAARYRWLRDGDRWHRTVRVMETDKSTGDRAILCDHLLDEAVDAEMLSK